MERFAVVDVETTGGRPGTDRMVEIGIVVLEDGQITAEYQTLLNPGRTIPLSVQAIHGISNEMVAGAPSFQAVAAEITRLTRDAIFVAHNAGFDYGFVKAAFMEMGIAFQEKKACSVRYARKVLPGLRSYSLANLTHFFGLVNEQAHRALSDARVTATVWQRLLELDPGRQTLQHLIRGKNGINRIPPQMEPSAIDRIPGETGVYWFRNSGGKVLYVGKAKNIKERVLQHFSGHTHTREKRAFLRDVAGVEFQITGHELMALLLENEMVKRHYPPFNSLLKDFRLNTGWFCYADREGFLRLVPGQAGKWSHPVRVFPSREEALSLLLRLSMEHGLCLKRNGLLEDSARKCLYEGPGGRTCRICHGKENPETYNAALETALNPEADPTPLLVSVNGRQPGERGMIWMEKGKILATGFSALHPASASPNEILAGLQGYYDTSDAQGILQPYLGKASSDRTLTTGGFRWLALENTAGTEDQPPRTT